MEKLKTLPLLLIKPLEFLVKDASSKDKVSLQKAFFSLSKKDMMQASEMLFYYVSRSKESNQVSPRFKPLEYAKIVLDVYSSKQKVKSATKLIKPLVMTMYE